MRSTCPCKRWDAKAVGQPHPKLGVRPVTRRKFEKSFKARALHISPSFVHRLLVLFPLEASSSRPVRFLGGSPIYPSLSRARTVVSPPLREASRGGARSEEGGAVVLRLLADQHEARFVDVTASGSVGEVRALFSLSSSFGFASRARRVGSPRLCFSFASRALLLQVSGYLETHPIPLFPLSD
jgi:hypothetical protein